MLFIKLVYGLVGILIGIYTYGQHYLALLLAVPVLWKWRKAIYILIPTMLIGMGIAYSRTSYVNSGVVSYVNNNSVFLENQGLYTCNNHNLKIGDKIQFTHYHSKITSIRSKTKGTLWLPKFVLSHRQSIIDTLRSSPHYGFWLAVLMGDRSTLDSNTSQTFLLSGVYHFLCISGFQFSLLYQVVYLGLYALFQRSKKLNYLCTIHARYDILPKALATVVCLYYFSISLFSISAIRAMLILIASFSGYSSKTLLTITMICMLAYNPLYAYNLGFMMSFLGSYMLYNRAKFYDVTVAMLPFTSVITPFGAISNLIGIAPMTVLTLWGILASVLRSSTLLNAANPIIVLLERIFNSLSYSVYMTHNDYMLPAFGACLYMYILLNQRILIYFGCLIVLFIQIMT